MLSLAIGFLVSFTFTFVMIAFVKPIFMRWLEARLFPPTQEELSRKALDMKPPQSFDQRVAYKVRKGKVNSYTNNGVTKR